MRTIRKRIDKLNPISIYTIVCMACLFVITIVLVINGSVLLERYDGFSQQYTYLFKLKHFLTDWFHLGKMPAWSWDTGLGMDTFIGFTQVLVNPFEYINLAFPEKYFDVGYTVSGLMQIYFVGLTMTIYLKHRNMGKFYQVIGGIGYAFCSWNLFSQINPGFLWAPLLLPLMIMGVDKILNKKSPALLIIAVGYGFINSFYFTYMSAIIVGIYTLLAIFMSERNATKEKLILLAKVVGYLCISFLIITPFVISILYGMKMTATSSAAEFSFLNSIYSYILFVPRFFSWTEINGNYFCISVLPIFVLMLPKILLRVKIKSVNSIMTVLLIVMTFSPVFGSLFNGFSYPTGRWTYGIMFFLIVAAIECFQTKISEKQIYYFMGALIVYASILLCVRLLGQQEFTIFLINIIFGFIYLFLFVKNKRKAIVAVITMNVMVLCVFLYGLSDGGFKNSHQLEYGTAYDSYMGSKLRVVNELKDDSFYRVDMIGNINNGVLPMCIPNEAYVWGAKTVSVYNSMTNKLWYELAAELENNNGYYKRVTVTGNENRERSDFLMGVKYYLGEEKEKADNQIPTSQNNYHSCDYKRKGVVDGVDVYENQHNIGLGTVYYDTINHNDWLKYSPLQREQIMMQAAVVENKDNLTLDSAGRRSLDVETKRLQCSIEDSEGKQIKKNIVVSRGNGQGKITVKSSNVYDCETYLIVKNLKRMTYLADEDSEKKEIHEKNSDMEDAGSFHIYARAGNIVRRLSNTEGSNQGYTDNDDFYVNISELGNFNGECELDLQTPGTYTFDSIEVVSVPNAPFRTQAKKLEESKFDVSDYNSNYVKGIVNAKADGLLYLSILYQEKGWNIWIDGKQVPSDQIQKVNVAFTGVNVTQGKHTIELRYTSMGVKEGIIPSAVGIVLFIGVMWNYRRKRRKLTR